jgi:ketosteroid isomerase-like protein
VIRIQKAALALLLFGTSAISISAGAAKPSGTFNRPEDVKAVTDLEMQAAGESDVDKVMQNYAPDAVMADYITPGWYEGKDQIRSAIAPQFAAIKGFKYTMDEINVATNGTFACAATVVRFDGTTKDDKAFAVAVRQLDAWKKIDGKWHLIQQHVSVPADPKTGVPIMNGPLTPRGPLQWAADAIPAPSQSAEQGKADIYKWLVANIIPIEVDEAVGTYGPGDDIILFDTVFPREHRGLQEYRSYFSQALAGTKSFEYRIPAFKADSDGAFGVQISTLDLKIAMQDGSTQYMSFRQSDCMRRVDGKWYSFLGMGSFPIDMKTGKAVMANPAAFGH